MYMKTAISILLKAPVVFIWLTTHVASGQQLTRNETDEFTGDKVKETSYEILIENLKIVCKLRMTNLNDSTFIMTMALIPGLNQANSIAKDAILFLKLTDGSVVELRNMEYALACLGCAATTVINNDVMGFKVKYAVSKNNLEKLKSSGLKKIRIYTSTDYIESDIKDQRADVLKREIRLVQ